MQQIKQHWILLLITGRSWSRIAIMRGASLKGTLGSVQIAKLCMDAKDDRKTYEKIANDPNCEILDKQWNSTPKGVQWMTVEYRDSSAPTQPPDLPSGGVTSPEED
jgi:hypothetical protein